MFGAKMIPTLLQKRHPNKSGKKKTRKREIALPFIKHQ